MVKFGPNPAWTPIFSLYGHHLTTPLRLRRSPGKSELALPGDLRSLGGVVKRRPNWLKIGVQVGFGPNFTVEFEAFFQKKFGQAYCTAHNSFLFTGDSSVQYLRPSCALWLWLEQPWWRNPASYLERSIEKVTQITSWDPCFQ